MRVVLQRVSAASVTVNSRIVGQVGPGPGLVALVGFEEKDDVKSADLAWMAGKIATMRIFDDEEGEMNCSILDMEGNVLVVSQFTLFAETKKGNRPSFKRAAESTKAVELYEAFIDEMEKAMGKKVPTGEFGEEMQIAMVNEGPMTIWLDSRNKE